MNMCNISRNLYSFFLQFLQLFTKMRGSSSTKSQNLKQTQKEILSIPQKGYKFFQQIKVKQYKLDQDKKLRENVSGYQQFYSGTIFQLKCMEMIIQVSKNIGQSSIKDNNFLYNQCCSESFTTLNECVKQIIGQFQKNIEQNVLEKEQFGDSSSQKIEELEKCDQKQLFDLILPWNENKDQAIQGDFDILLSKTETVNFHQKIKESMVKINTSKFWINENYNKLEDFQNKEKDAIFIFEVKKNIKGMNDSSIKDQDNMRKIVEKLQNQKLKEFLMKNILSTRIISVLSQMLKHVIAARSGQYRMQSQNQKFSFMNYINEKPQQINYPPKIKPVIMFYLILNNNLKEDEILEFLNPFKKILQFWFEKLKVSLTLIGYNDDQKSQEYQQLKNLLLEQKEEHQKEKQREKEEHQKEKQREKEEHQKEKQSMLSLIRKLQEQVEKLKKEKKN